MQDGAAEINLNEDLVRSRRWRQIKLIVLQEEQARRRRASSLPPPLPPARGAVSPFNGQLLLTARIDPFSSNLQQHLNLELFTFKRTKVCANWILGSVGSTHPPNFISKVDLFHTSLLS